MCGVVRSDIDTRADAVDDRMVGNPYAGSIRHPIGDISNRLAAPVINPQIGDSHDHEFATRGACDRASVAGGCNVRRRRPPADQRDTDLYYRSIRPYRQRISGFGPGYEYTFQITGWGWVNLLTGLVLAAVAVALFLNATWARVAAIVVTCLAIVVTFLWMPYYPTGAIVLIALDAVAIWGVATRSPSRDRHETVTIVIGMGVTVSDIDARRSEKRLRRGQCHVGIRSQRDPR